MISPNQITAHSVGWPPQFRFAGSVFWSGVCEFRRSAAMPYRMLKSQSL